MLVESDKRFMNDLIVPVVILFTQLSYFI